MNPLVSICIPTFNGSKYLQEALDSIELQTYELIEVVVSDDESSDGTWEILEAYKERASFPVYLYKHQPSSIGANWNNCIKHANGEYIKFLFQDDVLYPDCIAVMADKLQNDKSLVAVASQRSFYAKNTGFSNWIDKYGYLQFGLNENQKDPFILNQSHFKEDVFLQSPLNKVGEPSAVIFRKNVTDHIGLFSEDLVQILDYVYWYRLLTLGNILVLPQELVAFRLHSNQTTQINVMNRKDESKAYRYFLYTKLLKYLSKNQRKRLKKEFHPFHRFKNRLTSIFQT